MKTIILLTRQSFLILLFGLLSNLVFSQTFTISPDQACVGDPVDFSISLWQGSCSGGSYDFQLQRFDDNNATWDSITSNLNTNTNDDFLFNVDLDDDAAWRILVIEDDGDTCVTSNSEILSVTEVPTVNSVSNESECEGEFVTVNFTGTAGASFSWTNTNTSIGLGSSGSGNISFLGANPGTSNITGQIVVTPSLNGCDGDPETFNIQIRPTPTLTSPNDITVCAGVPVSILFNEDPSNATVSWTNNVGSSIGLPSSGAGDISFTAQNVTAGDIVATITATPTLSGCPGNSVNFTITIKPVPFVSTPSDVSVCPGETASVIFSGTSGATYSWTNNNTSIGLSSNGNGNISFSGTNNTSTEICGDVTVTPSLGSCSGSSETFEICIKPNPVMTPIGPFTACAGDPVGPIVFSSTPMATSFNWTNDNLDILPVGSGSGDIGAFSSNNVGVANITVTPVLAGCTGPSFTFQINITESPVLQGIADAAYCAGEQIMINFDVMPNGSDISWTNTNPLIGLSASGTGNISGVANDVSSQQTGIITATPSISGGCPGDPVNFNVIVNPRPTGIVVSDNSGTSDDNIICAGDEVTLSSGGDDCTWTNNGGLTEPPNNSCLWVITDLSMTTNFQVLIENSFGCQLTDMVTITYNAEPDFEIEVESPCIGEDLSLSSSMNFMEYEWTKNGNAVAGGTGSGISFPNAQASDGGDYCLNVVDAGGCEWVTCITLDVLPLPVPVLEETYSTVCQNAQAYYKVENISASSNFIWEINPGTEGTDWEIDTVEGILFVHWLTPGDYTIEVTEYFGSNPNTDCIGSNTLPVTVTTDIAPDAAQIFHYDLNDILIVKDPDVTCYQWGYYDPVTRSMVTVPGETFQAFAATGDAIRAYDENRTYWVETWNVPAGQPCGTPSCSTISFRMEEATGLIEEEEEKFLIYPNPNAGDFQLEVNKMPKESYQLSIVDMFGRVVEQRTIQTNNGEIKEDFKFDLSFCSGVYTLLIYDDLDIYKTGKFVVIH